jgi:dTDP-4-amino-4,6-dideoxygalactose transaminase
MIYLSKVWVDKGMRRAAEKVLDSGIFVMGKYTKEFEKNFSDHMNVKHAIALSNGTVAIEISLQSLNVTHGDEIIVTSHTAFPTIEAILRMGAKPVFVDIEESTYNLDISKIEKKITKKTKAILPVHLYGHPCDMGGIKEIAEKHSLKIIEDCAQAHNAEFNGAKVGSLGDVGCFSFYPSKNMTVCGEGGMITTNNDSTAEMARKLINHGQEGTYNHVIIGNNYRLGEMQCAIGIEQLKKLDYFTKRRRKIAKMYSDLLGPGIVLPEEKNYAKHAYHLYVIRCNSHKRSSLMNFMKEKNVQCGIHYPRACHQQKAVPKHYCNESLPVTEKIVKEIVSLPIYPLLSDDDVEMIASSMTKGINTV